MTTTTNELPRMDPDVLFNGALLIAPDEPTASRAESGLLGACLANPDILEELRDVKPENLSTRTRGQLLEVMRELGPRLEMVTLVDALERRYQPPYGKGWWSVVLALDEHYFRFAPDTTQDAIARKVAIVRAAAAARRLMAIEI